MDKKKGIIAIGSSWFSYLALSCSVQNLCHHELHKKVWAVYVLPVAYVVFTVLAVVITVLFIRKKMYKYLLIPAISLVMEVVLADEAIGCVKDVIGGTETFSTAYYRIDGREIRWFEEDNDDYHYFELDKKLAKEIKGHCTYDESETMSVDKGAMEVFSCTEVAEITYYPNSRTVTDIRFTPKNG